MSLSYIIQTLQISEKNKKVLSSFSCNIAKVLSAANNPRKWKISSAYWIYSNFTFQITRIYPSEYISKTNSLVIQYLASTKNAKQSYTLNIDDILIFCKISENLR